MNKKLNFSNIKKLLFNKNKFENFLDINLNCLKIILLCKIYKIYHYNKVLDIIIFNFFQKLRIFILI